MPGTYTHKIFLIEIFLINDPILRLEHTTSLRDVKPERKGRVKEMRKERKKKPNINFLMMFKFQL